MKVILAKRQPFPLFRYYPPVPKGQRPAILPKKKFVFCAFGTMESKNSSPNQHSFMKFSEKCSLQFSDVLFK